MTQYKPGSKSLSDDQEDLPDKLNTFYGGFDTDNTQEIENVKNIKHSSSGKGTITITNSDVYKHFKSLNPRKSKGRDGVSPKLLRVRACSQQLSPVYATIFTSCVNEHIHSIWKTATVIPVPKKSSPKELNDYGPISLTSVPFKIFEIIVREHLCRESASVLDKHQFSCQKKKDQ